MYDLVSSQYYSRKNETGPEIFESDANQYEDTNLWGTYSRNYTLERKSDENVIEDTIDPAEAFKKFANKQLDLSNVDFSKNADCQAGNSVKFSQDSGCSESMAARYKRLITELKDLENEAGAIEKADKKMGGAKIQSAAKDLISTMKKLEGNGRFESVMKKDHPMVAGEAQAIGACSALKEEINKVENPPPVEEVKSEMKGISYEFYGLGGGAAERTQEIVILDRRLAALESTIGNTRLAMMPNIRTSLEFIGRKMEVLDRDKMRNAEKKMNSLAREMKTLERDKNKLAGAKKSDYQKKIAELYGMMGRWDQSSQQLPIVVARLQSIKDMHEAGKGSQGQLQSVIKEREKTENLLKENGQLLADTNNKLKGALDKMKKMLDVEKSINGLKSKYK